MCGIAGFQTASAPQSASELTRLATGMNNALRHRGPDDEGVWVDGEAGIALAHRRLSIIDLSPAGHQPMVSADGRMVMIYNGEVYSHNEMRPDLEARGIRFRGHSDTEVMLESFAAFGVEATVQRFVGMFTIALWDRQTRTLWLIRDRLGIKPLYWAHVGGLFLFGSELKALRAHPGWTARIDRGAVASFMRHNYIPAPQTIYQGINKLEPGSILTLPWRGEPRITRFWDARSVALAGVTSRIEASDEELTERLDTLLSDAVKRRMMADVPLGAFLSGGVDSSTVVALMQKDNASRVKTFTIGFDIDGFDEAPHAAAVARHLGTDHTELTVTAKQALDVIPRLPEWFDEPFSDSSQIPTYFVSAMTRQHVTVALSGDGGDELFAGYNRYHLTRRFWTALRLLPKPLRRSLAAALTSVSADRWTNLFRVWPRAWQPAQVGDKLHKFAAVLNVEDPSALYLRLISHCDPAQLMPGTPEPRGLLSNPSVTRDFPDLLDRMQLLDLVTYLPDDILTKVDRASMAVALEARVPLLDHRVVEFAWRLPQSAKLRGGKTKWLLRQVLDRYVPRSLIERPKMGFGIPLGDWLRGPLRDWVETLLAEQRLREAGLLDATQVRRLRQEHLEGGRNWQYLLWNVLMLEAWRERWGSTS
jgi:asparagine synthase (glutamine-hydrolysing)